MFAVGLSKLNLSGVGLFEDISESQGNQHLTANCNKLLPRSHFSRKKKLEKCRGWLWVVGLHAALKYISIARQLKQLLGLGHCHLHLSGDTSLLLVRYIMGKKSFSQSFAQNSIENELRNNIFLSRRRV